MTFWQRFVAWCRGPMDVEQAHQRAKEMWGSLGWALVTPTDKAVGHAERTFGSGQTFEEAFERAAECGFRSSWEE